MLTAADRPNCSVRDRPFCSTLPSPVEECGWVANTRHVPLIEVAHAQVGEVDDGRACPEPEVTQPGWTDQDGGSSSPSFSSCSAISAVA